ncbi:hypothetical protein DOY81_002126 [Sarcophaga bullata]|nr:hypothetical protein DOY81_002126 [Sarcophaga bullata]
MTAAQTKITVESYFFCNKKDCSLSNSFTAPLIRAGERAATAPQLLRGLIVMPMQAATYLAIYDFMADGGVENKFYFVFFFVEIFVSILTI